MCFLLSRNVRERDENTMVRSTAKIKAVLSSSRKARSKKKLSPTGWRMVLVSKIQPTWHKSRGGTRCTRKCKWEEFRPITIIKSASLVMQTGACRGDTYPPLKKQSQFKFEKETRLMTGVAKIHLREKTDDGGYIFVEKGVWLMPFDDARIDEIDAEKARCMSGAVLRKLRERVCRDVRPGDAPRAAVIDHRAADNPYESWYSWDGGNWVAKMWDCSALRAARVRDKARRAHHHAQCPRILWDRV